MNSRKCIDNDQWSMNFKPEIFKREMQSPYKIDIRRSKENFHSQIVFYPHKASRFFQKDPHYNILFPITPSVRSIMSAVFRRVPSPPRREGSKAYRTAGHIWSTIPKGEKWMNLWKWGKSMQGVFPLKNTKKRQRKQAALYSSERKSD